MEEVDSCLPGGQAPSHWYDTWDRQSCQSFSSTAKGLRNAPGENNCFLNSAVQVSHSLGVINLNKFHIPPQELEVRSLYHF